MLSKEALDCYRRMTLSQRLKLVLEMTRDNTSALFNGPPELVARRFELLEKQNNERNAGLLEVFARAKQR